MLTDIPGYIGIYQISSQGEIFSTYRKRFLKGWVESTGYHVVSLRKNGSRCNRTVHSLLAQVFIPNPMELPEVNHIDGDKLNNSLSNLEWISGVDNIRHAFTTGLTKQAACIDYQKVPDLLNELIAGTPLRDMAAREGIKETSTLRKLLLREATRTNKLSEFNKGIKAANTQLVQEQSHCIQQYTLEGIFIQEFSSINAAARAIGRNPGGVFRAIKQSKAYCNYLWEKSRA